MLGEGQPMAVLESNEKMKELMMPTLHPHITGVSCVDIAFKGVMFFTELLTKSSREPLDVGRNFLPVRKKFSE